jgi:uncharacterized membrane protein
MEISMSKKNVIIIAAITSVFAASSSFAAKDTSATQQGEKCYGIVKAGMNDCNTAKSSCAGSATKDKQGDAYLFLPKGACKKIVGGSLTPIKEDKSN